MTSKRILRKNGRAGVVLQEIKTRSRGAEHRTYVVYDLLAKERMVYHTRKEAEKEYRRLVKENWEFLKEMREKIRKHKKEIEKRKKKRKKSKKHKRKR